MNEEQFEIFQTWMMRITFFLAIQTVIIFISLTWLYEIGQKLRIP